MYCYASWAKNAELPQAFLEILDELLIAPGERSGTRDQHVVLPSARVGRQNDRRYGAQAPARAIAGDRIANLAAGGEAHAHPRAIWIGANLQDETWRHPFAPARSNPNEVCPSGQARQRRHWTRR